MNFTTNNRSISYKKVSLLNRDIQAAELIKQQIFYFHVLSYVCKEYGNLDNQMQAAITVRLRIGNFVYVIDVRAYDIVNKSVVISIFIVS